jgi:O-antigen/teichoic acid export membrane protein
MHLPRVLRNVGMASIQVLFSAGVLFALYYFLLRTIGAKELGIWSVVLATSSTARLSELGLSGGVVRFVAKYVAQRDPVSASVVVQTATLSVAAFMTVVLIALYPVFVPLIQYFLPAESQSAGLSLIPFALMSLWLGSLSGIYTSSLDGLLRTDIRSLIIMSGVGLHFALVLIFVPQYGLLGLAYAQVIQGVFVLILGWTLLRRYLSSLPVLPYRWSSKIFGEIFRYGLNLQVGTAAQMLFDPATKMILSKFGGLELVAYYEMANRMVQQLRNLIVSANQVLVPVYAGFSEASPERIAELYRKSFGLLLFVGFPVFSALIAMVPAVSEIWVGAYDTFFVWFSVMLAIAWFLNTLNAPAYFANMGTGDLNWNTIAHVVIGVLNVLFGITLGAIFGGAGVVVGCSVALIFGSALIIFNYHKKNDIHYRNLIPREHLMIILTSIFLPVVNWQLYEFLRQHIGIPSASLVSVVVVVGIFFPITWVHPIRREFMERVITCGK